VGSDTVANWTASAKIVFNGNAPTAGGRKIFYPPDIAEEESHFMLFLGTGDRAHPNGKDVVERIYVIKDRRDTTLDEDDLVDVTLNRLQDDTASSEEKCQIRADLDTKDGWFIQLSEAAGEKALSRAIIFGGIFYITTFTPAEEVGGTDPCANDQGTAKLYALSYLTGEAILNLDLANDPLGDEALERSDRSMVIGSYIPSDLVLVIQGRDVRYYVSVGTEGGPGIKTGWPGEGSSLYSTYWREMF
jgi:type IV pilus assembly protein PilY1